MLAKIGVRHDNLKRLRLSTIRHADRIYVLEKGTVTQSGTFDELAAEPGLFTSMLERQTQ